MAYLTVSILARDEAGFEAQVQAAKEKGAEAVEIRMDSLQSPGPEIAAKLVMAAQKKEIPVIVTCRDKAEGGVAELDLTLRLGILREAIAARADFIDIEFENFKHPDVQSVLQAMLEQYPSTQLIISRHNFQGPFENIRQVYESILAVYPEAIPKIVYTARHINDCFAAFDLLSEADCPVITFAMGQAGQISRILAKKFGAFLTFASLDDDSATAAGQISVEQMKSLFRWDHQNARTEIFGVVGNPVGHSLSPVLYNACFDAADMNAVYLPFLVEGQEAEFNLFLKNAIDRWRMGFGGFSVTLPHKTRALDYANQHGDFVDGLAETIGAVNTFKIGFNGITSGYNTDYAGAMDALTASMDADERDLHAQKVAVLGAGGAARAVVAGLTDLGARVTIYNRTVKKAQSLAQEFRCKAASIDELADLNAAVVINCTSVGMHPDSDASPLPEGVIKPDMTVFDTVYNPVETRLLRQAKAAGAATVNGAEMFIRQAMAQYKIFIGDDPDQARMRQVVLNHLRGK